MSTAAPLPLALTMGDPAGVGLDITLRAWQERARLSGAVFFLIGDPQALAARARRLGMTVPIDVIAAPGETRAVFARSLPVLPLAAAAPVDPGRPSAANAPAIIRAIARAVALTHAGLAGAVVTNPIAKSVLYQAGFAHPGHTEFLAELAGRHWGGRHRSVMLLAAEMLRVVPLTVHIPLSKVPSAITRDLVLDTVAITARALKSDFAIPSPRIAICGLNPHAGEDGAMGSEERDIIMPAILELQHQGHAVSGPHPADTMFHPGARARYDAAIAMYHDQALVPLKTLAFDEGVNVTLGLPFVRTSPDHGTGFDIAGSGRARATSLIEALKLADWLAANRLAARS